MYSQILLCIFIYTVSTLQYIYMPPKKRKLPKHVTKMHTGKLPRREASVITSAEPTAAALPSAVSSGAIAAVVMRHLVQSGRLLSASTETVLPTSMHCSGKTVNFTLVNIIDFIRRNADRSSRECCNYIGIFVLIRYIVGRGYQFMLIRRTLQPSIPRYHNDIFL